MEVTVSNLDGIGPDDVVSVRLGQTRRQGPASALGGRGLKFPAPQDGSEQALQVEVLAPVAAHRLALHPERPEYSLALEGPGGRPMRMRLGVRRDGGGGAGGSAPERSQLGARAEPGPIRDSAALARQYLARHGLLEYLQSLLEVVVQDRPQDPYRFLWNQLGSFLVCEEEDQAAPPAYEGALGEDPMQPGMAPEGVPDRGPDHLGLDSLHGAPHSSERTKRAEYRQEAKETVLENRVLQDMVEKLHLELEAAVKREHCWRQKEAPEAEQRAREAEQRALAAEQRAREAEQRALVAEQSAREAEQSALAANAELREQVAKQKDREAEQRALVEAIADDGRLPDDSSLLLQRIMVLLQLGDTFRKWADRIFSEHAVDNQGLLDGEPGQRVLPMSCLGEVFMHWNIPKDHISTFWALLRKQNPAFHEATLPDHISYQDFHDVFLRTLRRLRDMYSPEPRAVSKDYVIRQNTQELGVVYEINDTVGRGSFGEVAFVTHRRSKRQRMVKRISFASEGGVSSEKYIEEIKFELNILRELDHPNIVKIFEWFEGDSTYWLVMQAARGGDLRQMLKRIVDDQDVPGLGEPVTSHITSQVLKALCYIHETKHIVHRDIKPANMLLATPDYNKPEILLADFGVAELFDDRSSHNVKGVVEYMAPEVFESKVGPGVDVWAMGIVVYELLCGERLIKAGNPMAMFAKLRTTTIDYRLVQEAGASEAAVLFIRQLLQKKVEDRSTARQALEDAWLSHSADHFVRSARQSVVSFTNASHFTKVALNCIAAHMDSFEVDGLAAMFRRFDVDNDGKLSTGELAEGLMEMQIDSDSVEEMVRAVDMGHNGSVEYSEFAAALLATQRNLVDDVVWHAFEVFDADGDGQISLDELRDMLCQDGPHWATLPDGKNVDEVLKEIDTSRDGAISFREFRDYIMQDTGSSWDQLDREEPLMATMARTPPPEAELVAQAERLAQQHWRSTIGNVQQLSEAVGVEAAELSDDAWQRLKQKLMMLDDRLVEVLQRGDIRLVRIAWLLQQPPTYRMEHRQELERREEQGEMPTPLLSGVEAVDLVRRGDRSVAALTYGWLSPGDPDPAGARMTALRKGLSALKHVEALFWDFPSLHQKPAGADRTEAERAAFDRSLDVMGDLYASAVGTTVIQLQEIPRRPPEFDGEICLFNLDSCATEDSVRSAFEKFGQICDCCLTQAGRQPPTVRFATHDMALSARNAFLHMKEAPEPKVCDGVDTLYNEQSYHGRAAAEAGRAADTGRGWCIFESSVSSEVIARLSAYPSMSKALQALPPKMHMLSSHGPPQEVVLKSEDMGARTTQVRSMIAAAKFTGKGDQQKVIDLYVGYVERIAELLAATFGFDSDRAHSSMDFMPLHLPLYWIASQPLGPGEGLFRLVEGQCVIVPPAGQASQKASHSLGVIDHTHERVALVHTSNHVELTVDSCSQAVLPWSGTEHLWDPQVFLRDTQAFPQCLPALLMQTGGAFPQLVLMQAVRKLAAAVNSNVALRCLLDSASLAEVSEFFQLFKNAKTDFFKLQYAQRVCEAAAAAKQHIQELMSYPNHAAACAFQASGALGIRYYAPSQMLTVRYNGVWEDAEVLQAGNPHTVVVRGHVVALPLHPWNHAVRLLASADFQSIHSWFREKLGARHKEHRDALTGRRLDVLEQCVPIQVLGSPAGRSALIRGAGEDAHSLSKWLASTHAALRTGRAQRKPTLVLITAPPASGKTTLISQIVTNVLVTDRNWDMIPIVIRASTLHAKLEESPDVFANAWNWCDAWLQLVVTGPSLGLYKFMRQAMLARRALIFIDGLDEGGHSRQQIESHIVDVLGPQGHIVVVTSRPASVDWNKFQDARRLQLSPLSGSQQLDMLSRRFRSEAEASKLIEFIRKTLPLDTQTGDTIAGNPLMLSMCASVYELRMGVGMPDTAYKLYDNATEAMMERGGLSADTRGLLEAICFDAHMKRTRLITETNVRDVGRSMALDDEVVETFLEDLKMDHVPLISLLQRAPLQIQASHLSFQEYFAAKLFCQWSTSDLWPLWCRKLSVEALGKPWQCSAWFALFTQFGCEKGVAFTKALGQTAQVGDVFRANEPLEPDSSWDVTLQLVLSLMSQASTVEVVLDRHGDPPDVHIKRLEARKGVDGVPGKDTLAVTFGTGMADAEANVLIQLLRSHRAKLPPTCRLQFLQPPSRQNFQISWPVQGNLLAAAASLRGGSEQQLTVEGLLTDWLVVNGVPPLSKLEVGCSLAEAVAAALHDSLPAHVSSKDLSFCIGKDLEGLDIVSLLTEALATFLPTSATCCLRFKKCELSLPVQGSMLAAAAGLRGGAEQPLIVDGLDTANLVRDGLLHSGNVSVLRSCELIGEDGVAALAPLLPACLLLEELGLQSDRLGEKGLSMLLGALPDCPTLRKLKVKFRDMGDTGAMALAKLLPSHRAARPAAFHFTGPNLPGPRRPSSGKSESESESSYTDIGLSVQGYLLAAAAAHRCGAEQPVTVEGLDTAGLFKERLLRADDVSVLRSLHIGLDGVESSDVWLFLKKALLETSAASVLHRLKLGGGHVGIGTRGAVEVAALLPACSSLTELDLSLADPTDHKKVSDRLGDDGLAALLGAVPSCPTLTKLDVSNNDFSKESLTAARAVLQEVIGSYNPDSWLR